MTDTDWANDAPEDIGKALADKHLRLIEEDVTMDAIKYLRKVLRVHADDPPVWVDRRILALALDEFDATQARAVELAAALRAVCDRAEYIDPYEADLDVCELCGGGRDDGRFHHAPGCPVAVARRVLGD